jgi:hypothetical protein
MDDARAFSIAAFAEATSCSDRLLENPNAAGHAARDWHD